jgi:hypothetical protein
MSLYLRKTHIIVARQNRYISRRWKNIHSTPRFKFIAKRIKKSVFEKPIQSLSVLISIIGLCFGYYQYRAEVDSKHRRAARDELFPWRKLQKEITVNIMKGEFNKRDSLLLMCNFPAGGNKIHSEFMTKPIEVQTDYISRMLSVLIDDPHYSKDILYRIRPITHNTDLLQKAILYI